MKLKECIFYSSACYNWSSSSKNLSAVKGIVVHSTGANNPSLKRYVQPTAKNKDYSAIIADVGKNIYGNHWNSPSISVCVHAFIGKNAKGEIETYQVLPYDRCCWGCGKASKGSYNYNPNAHIQFEICEDALTDETYFNKVMTEAQEYCAYLCKKFNLDVSTVVSHAEAHKKGYASNHGDIDHWLKKFGKTMDWFRAQVKAKMSTEKDAVSTEEKEMSTASYRVGKALQLKNEKLFRSSTDKTAKSTVSGTYYIWSNEVINGRIKITIHKSYVGIAGMVTGWIDAPEISFVNGEILKLEKTPLYISAYTKNVSIKKTGTFFVWDKSIINGRIRITNKTANVGVAGAVTGWVNVSDI